MKEDLTTSMGAAKRSVQRWAGRRAFEGADPGEVTSVQGAELMVKAGGQLAQERKKATKKDKEK